MIRILIADDHNLVRQALAQMLQMERDLIVVAQASNAPDAIDQCKLLAPDVVLMDVHMPRGKEGIEATFRITHDNPHIKVIMLTMERHDEFLYDAIKAGAQGYLLKEVNSEELIKAIRAVAANESVINPAMAHKMLEEFKHLGDRDSQDHPYEQLTEREKDILSALGQGASNSEIARNLGITEKTVSNRLSVIFQKLHLNNRTQAALYAVREGLSHQKYGSS